MIHIQVAQNHDISIPQLIKKANEIEKKTYPISLGEKREEEGLFMMQK